MNSRARASLLAAAARAAAARSPGRREPAHATTRRRRATFKVGLVADVGQLNDHGFNQLAYQGLKQAERELGVKGRVVESASAADYIPNMVALARQGYDLIIGVGFAQGDAIAAVAKQFPNTHFAIVDVDQRDLKGKPKNVVGLLFKEQEVGYLAGYLAALSEKRRRRPRDQRRRRLQAASRRPLHRRLQGRRQEGGARHQGDLGLLAGLGRPGEVQGARALPDRARLGCRLPGRRRVRARRARRRREKSVWGIGVDADQSFLGPYVLTSAQKGVDAAVFLTIKALQDGTFKGGRNAVFGLDAGRRRARQGEPEASQGGRARRR